MNTTADMAGNSDAVGPTAFFTSDDHQKIEDYVAYGSRLPVVIQAVTVYIGYDHAGVAGLEPADLQDLFKKIRANTAKWEPINDSVSHQTRQLASISAKVVQHGKALIGAIEAMPFYKRVAATVGQSLDDLPHNELPNEPFSDADAAKKPGLLKQLDALGTLNAQQVAETDETLQEVAAFKREVGHLEPVVANKSRAIKSSNLEIGRETTVEPMIAALQAEYDRTLRSGGPGDPIATAKRKQLVAAIDKLKSQIEVFRGRQRVTYTMGRLFVHFSEIGIAMVNAEMALGHLWTDWAQASSALDRSRQELGGIESSQKLLSFLNTFRLAINDWALVKDKATELYRAF